MDSLTIQEAETNLATVDEMPEHLQLVAYSKEQMQSAQKQLAEWFSRKLSEAEQQIKEASDAKTSALAGNFNTAPFHRLWQRAKKLAEFYEKALAAVEAGYVVMPDLPVDVFAVRTLRRIPLRKESNWARENREQSSEAPAIGEGRYVDSVPVEHQYRYDDNDPKTGEVVKKMAYFAAEFSESIDFPLSIAKPVIMDRVAEAMQMKIFDEIGVLPNRKEKKKDPIVAGIIRRPGDKYNQRRLMFLLAWYIDTKVL